jgi:hypothetical protein
MSGAIGTALSQQIDAGNFTKRLYALAPNTIGGGGGTTPSGTFVDGDAINRVDPSVALAGIPVIPAKVTLASGQSVVVQRRVQHRDSSASAWADYGTQPGDVTIVGNNDGSAITLDLGDPRAATAPATGSITGLHWGIDLSGAKAEVRLRVKATLTASGADTVKLAGSLELAGLGAVPPAGE